MAIEDAMMALRDHWDDVMVRVGIEKASDLNELVEQLDGPGGPRVVIRIADLLVETLPPDHPVRRALVSGDLFQRSPMDWPSIGRVLRDRAKAIDVGEILRGVTARLLAAPALMEKEVRRRGVDPDDPGLIRLDRPDGGQQWPEFQFVPGDGPFPVVRKVNGLLGAHTDPIGVADWWLSRNGWLNDRPSALIGNVPDARLVSAARAVSAEV